MKELDNLNLIIDKLLYLIKYNEIENANDLNEYLLTHDFKEEEIKQFKRVFEEWGKMNVLNCVDMYNKGIIKEKSKLRNRIRGKT